jgi:predicted deacylase
LYTCLYTGILYGILGCMPGELAEGGRQSMSALPVLLIPGQNEEAVVWVQAGIHGDEQEAVLALKRYCQAARVTPPPLSLKILCPANLPAYEALSRCSPEDGLDLNRGFPGDRDGSPTRQAAATIWAEIESCQGVIDIHSSSDALIGAPHAIIQDGDTELHRAGHAAGLASGLPILWASRGAWLAGSLIHAAMTARIPACLLDIGSTRPWAKRDPLDSVLTPVLRSYASALGLDASPPPPAAGNGRRPVRQIGDPQWVTSPAPGWLVEIREPGSLVHPGEVIALVWAEDQGTDLPIRWEGPGSGLVVTVRAHRDVVTGTPLVSIAALPDPT